MLSAQRCWSIKVNCEFFLYQFSYLSYIKQSYNIRSRKFYTQTEVCIFLLIYSWILLFSFIWFYLIKMLDSVRLILVWVTHHSRIRIKLKKKIPIQIHNTEKQEWKNRNSKWKKREKETQKGWQHQLSYTIIMIK